jgi:acyl-CoA thioesterase-1
MSSNRKDTGRRNIVFFGDSVSFGEMVSPHRIWVSAISKRIEAEFGENDWLVVNTSINGNTTRMALDRMAFDVQRYAIDILIVQFGMNDCNYWRTDEGEPRVSEDSYRANLAEIAKRGKIFGAKKIYFMTGHPTPHVERLDYAAMSYEESRSNYSKIMREAALENVCELIDIECEIEQRFGKKIESFVYLLHDGIHLNHYGHTLYEEIVWPTIRSAIFSVSTP